MMMPALPPAWGSWKWSAPIRTGPDRGALASFTIPPTVIAHSRGDLADVRIVNRAGEEVPYAIVIRRGSAGSSWRDARLDDYGFVPGAYTQVVADAGGLRPDFGTLEISSMRRNFAARVNVYASDNRLTWRIIRRSAPIYDFQDEGAGSNLRVSFAPSHARWYRVEILDSTGPFAIDGVRFAQDARSAPELYRYNAGIVRYADAGSDTAIVLDASVGRIPISVLRVDSTTPLFARRVEVQTSDDASSWEDAASGDIVRTPYANKLSLWFDETRARYWRVSIANGNNAPLRGVRVSLWGEPRHVVFAVHGQGYRLLYGNPQAPAPVYDFTKIHRVGEIAAAPEVALGPGALNAVAVTVSPWTEGKPWVLWLGLAIVVVFVGGFAVRILLEERS